MNIPFIVVIAITGIVFFLIGSRVELMPSDGAPEHIEPVQQEVAKTNTVKPIEPFTTTVDSNTLDLSKQGLTKAPEYIFSKVGTTNLNLSFNRIEGSLQGEIRFMQNLRVLDLSHNNFTGLPAEVGQLKNLEVLNLSHNPLTGLPYELGNLSKLRTLDLRGTNYATVDLDVIRKSLPAETKIITD